MDTASDHIVFRREMSQLRSLVEKLDCIGEAAIKDKLISKKQAAGALGVSYRTIERWYNLGYIDRIRVGGRIFFRLEEVSQIVAGCRATNNKPLAQAIISRYSERIRR